MERQKSIAELRRAIQELDDAIKKTQRGWARELKRTKELLRKLEAPD